MVEETINRKKEYRRPRSPSATVAIFAATALTCVAGEPLDIPWYTIDGGGVMRSTSSDGVFALSGTIGQPDAGVLNGGDFRLTGGFWIETPPGDCNATGTVGLLDHEAFVNCLTGPAGDIAEGCECFDVNGSGTVDLADFSENQNNFIGE